MDYGRGPLLAHFGDAPVDATRSRMLSRVRGKDTGPEVAFRRAVWALGGRFRCHAKDVPGRPDLVNKRARVAVFVDGCFWHGCPEHFKVPKTRTAFWSEKIRRNQEKRAAVLDALAREWKVYQYFECDLEERGDACAREVAKALTSAPRPRRAPGSAARTRRGSAARASAAPR